MLRVLALTTAIAAFAASANAAEVTVSLAGKSDIEAHAAIAHAALQVCRDDLSTDPLSFYMVDSCIQATVAETWAKLGASPVAAAPSASRISVASR
jgi:hypothetical protein